MRNQIGPGKLLTVAVSANPERIGNIEAATVAGIVDWINVMTYDFHGSWDPVTGHNAPLLPVAGDNGWNVTDGINGWLGANVPARRLNLGLPWYGRTWAGVNCTRQGDPTTGIGCAATGAGPGTWEPGVVDYKDVADNYLNASGWVPGFDPTTKTPVLYNPTSGQFISYDDAASIEAKTEFAKSKNLGGLMVWELDADRSGVLLGAMR